MPYQIYYKTGEYRLEFQSGDGEELCDKGTQNAQTILAARLKLKRLMSFNDI